MVTEEQTDRRTSTVTLAAHARRGLINISCWRAGARSGLRCIYKHILREQAGYRRYMHMEDEVRSIK